MKPKIVLTKNLKLYEDQVKRLESLGDITYNNNGPKSPEDWFNMCKDADIICTGIFGLKSDKVYELKDVFISLPFVGHEFLDKKRLRENNIIVANSPGCNKEAVAEWIIGMTLLHFRRLSKLNKTKNKNKDEILKPGIALYDKTITILGSGQIGTHLGKICESFGMKVIFFKRGNDLLKSVENADVIANCLSVNETSTGLLDKNFFSSLKRGSFFVSTSRHQIYDIEALKDALDENILIGAADDAANAEVGDVSEPDYTKLLDHPKILVTPHIAWNTDSEQRKGNDIMIDNIEAWLNKKPINLIY
jgi:phosphoglycerate dehydrogenase-like enzyme